MANSMLRMSGSVCLLATMAAGCTPALPAGQSRGSGQGKSLAQTGSVTRATHRGSKNAAMVLVPMAGEPDDAALRQARLVTTSCQALEREAQAEQDRLLEEMRQAVRQELVNWRAEQPSCWQMYKQWSDEASGRGNIWGDEIGESFGAGGLGLSGVGEGGGGVGEGIGLGSIGVIGHGAGSGVGSGFGSGHGRLGGSAPRLGYTSAERTSHVMSGTNNQVKDVDEADIVKSDGDYVYFDGQRRATHCFNRASALDLGYQAPWSGARNVHRRR